MRQSLVPLPIYSYNIQNREGETLFCWPFRAFYQEKLLQCWYFRLSKFINSFVIMMKRLQWYNNYTWRTWKEKNKPEWPEQCFPERKIHHIFWFNFWLHIHHSVDQQVINLVKTRMSNDMLIIIIRYQNPKMKTLHFDIWMVPSVSSFFCETTK